MSQEVPTGRAKGRGKARGKARGAGEPTIQPGGPPRPQALPLQAVVPGTQPPQVSHVQPGGGRRAHRGVPRAEVETVTHAMQGMELGGDSAGRGGPFRRREEPGLSDNTRPAHIEDKRGSSGTQINLVANYFELLSKPEWAIHQYHVEFAPVVESPRIRRGLLHIHKEILGCYTFDGMSDVKCMILLENKVTELFSKRITDGENIRITMSHVAELAPHHPEVARLFNTQMRRNLDHLKYQLLGRHYFDQNAISEVPAHRLQVWQGVVTAIRQQEENVMMCVDTVHKVVRKETALEIIASATKNNPQGYRDQVVRDLVGAIVMTKYNNRTYRIEDINWDLDPNQTFETKEGSISYVQYYLKQYELRVRDLAQPLLLCTSKEREIRSGQRESKKIYILPELCCMTGLTDSMRNNFNMMRDLASKTKLDPDQRVRNLLSFINRVNSNPEVAKEMKGWGLRFSTEPVNLTGRMIPDEPITQGAGTKYQYDRMKADFSFEMRGKPMLRAVDLDNWIVISTRYDSQVCQEFINTLQRVCRPMGMRVALPKVVTIDNDRVASYCQALRETLTKDTNIVVFIVPNNKKDRYDAIKKSACIDFPVPSQVITSRLLGDRKKHMSATTKIGVQMNCKMGGEPWAVDIPMKSGVMVIGYDTYHDSSRRGCSAGGFVASVNQTFTRWYSKVSFHTAGGWQELSNHLRTNLTEALKKYQQINQSLPSLIFFFRDGVGDGQIRYVLEWEVKQFQETIRDLMEAGTPLDQMKTRFAFIVVNKKINTRVFHKEGQQRYTNPPPGTVIDSVVTRSDRYDFFLVSQSVRQGTVAPTMYNVIADRSGLKPEHMQRLSYKLTHLYFNFQGTIRVPAPCHYAHKLAFLAGQSLHKEPDSKLLDTLFYL